MKLYPQAHIEHYNFNKGFPWRAQDQMPVLDILGGNVVGECYSGKYNPSKYALPSVRVLPNKYYKSKEKDLPPIIKNLVNLIRFINDDRC